MGRTTRHPAGRSSHIRKVRPMGDPLLASPLLARIERLERENRRSRLVALLSTTLLFAWAACSVARAPEKVVAAERFVLTAPDGTEHGSLELDSKGNPALVLRKDKASAILTLAGPALQVRGADGKTGAFIGIDTRGISRVELSSERIVDGVRLAAKPDGSSGVYVLDPSGRERGSLEATSPGGAALLLRDPQGRPRGQFGIDPQDLPSLLLLDGGGARRTGMIVLEDGTPLLEMEDDRGRPRARLTTQFDGSPTLELLREDGAASFRAP